MARICITTFAGWGNCGDEGTLLAIMDALGEQHDYIVCTSLPHSMLADYKMKLPRSVFDVRQIYDVRDDYDAFILGGGTLSWGYGWRQALNAWSHEKPSMNYGVGYDWHRLYHPRLNHLYTSFLMQFDAITVRDKCSQTIADQIGEVQATLTCCPSINLKEEAFECPKNMVAVCPRYEDYESNEPQLNWLTERLAGVEDEVLLIPFAPYSSEGITVDLSLCLDLQRRLKGKPMIMYTDGFNPRKVKYAISRSKLVISGGRYHALVWASAHNVPFEYSPTSYHYPKVGAFEYMHKTYGSEKLKEMEKKNKEIFLDRCKV